MILAVAAAVAMVLLAIALTLGLVRLWRGPSLLDRIVAFDLMGMSAIGLVAAGAAQADQVVMFDVAVVVAVVAFLATAAFAGHYAERTANENDRDETGEQDVGPQGDVPQDLDVPQADGEGS